MLKAAVEELRSGNKEEVEIEQNIEILLPVEAFIPSFYIPESEDKISVYQKLAGSEDEQILGEFETDLREEYGEMPRQVETPFKILRLKLACRRGGVIRVKAEDRGSDRDIVLTLSARVTAKEIMQILGENPQWKISGNTLRIAESALKAKAKGGDWLDELKREVAALERKKEKKKEEAKEKEEASE
jgi:transcription-repair coupling factor (superfamily II helicase)